MTRPNGTKIVLDQHTTNPADLALGTAGTRIITYNGKDEGTWRFQVDVCFSDWVEDAGGDLEALTACPTADRQMGPPWGTRTARSRPRRISPPP